MPKLNETKSIKGSDRLRILIDPICERQISQADFVDTQQRLAVVLAELAPFLAQELRRA